MELQQGKASTTKLIQKACNLLTVSKVTSQQFMEAYAPIEKRYIKLKCTIIQIRFCYAICTEQAFSSFSRDVDTLIQRHILWKGASSKEKKMSKRYIEGFITRFW
jgi:hypothetical protein